MRRIRVMMIDDHRLLTKGIQGVIESYEQLEFVGALHHGKSAVHQCTDIAPDVLLLDVNLPDISGLRLCKKILQAMPSIRIIGLSMDQSISVLNKMLKAGAVGYLPKNTSATELIAAIKAVAQGEQYFAKSLREKLLRHFMGAQSPEETTSFVPQISPREREVLMAIANQLTSGEIADKLYISENTVDTHRRNLLLKFEAKNSVGLIRRAYECGLLEE